MEPVLLSPASASLFGIPAKIIGMREGTAQ